MEDVFGIVANVVYPDRCLRLGAKVWVLDIPGDPDRCKVRGLSRGGRVVTKWVTARRVGNVRVAFMPPQIRAIAHLRWPTRAQAELYLPQRWPEPTQQR